MLSDGHFLIVFQARQFLIDSHYFSTAGKWSNENVAPLTALRSTLAIFLRKGGR